MSCCQRQRLEPVYRQERCQAKKKLLRSPIPPNALRGLDGMKAADAILKRYGTAGILVGGLAKAISKGVIDPLRLEKEHKDVDVLIASTDCCHHPRQWEGGIDWWITHGLSERPTNGCANLVRNLVFYKNSEPGLYICNPYTLNRLADFEWREFGSSHEITQAMPARSLCEPDLPDVGFSYMTAHVCDCLRRTDELQKAIHCKRL